MNSESLREFYVENLDDCFSRSDDTVTAHSALEALEIEIWDELRGVMGDLEISREYIVEPQVVDPKIGTQTFQVVVTATTDYPNGGLEQTISISIAKTEVTEINPDQDDEDPLTPGTPDDARLEEVEP